MMKDIEMCEPVKKWIELLAVRFSFEHVFSWIEKCKGKNLEFDGPFWNGRTLQVGACQFIMGPQNGGVLMGHPKSSTFFEGFHERNQAALGDPP